MRPVLESDAKGVPTGYNLVPAGAKEYQPVYRLAEPGSQLFCDKGPGGREFQSSLKLIDVELITPDKHKLGQRPPAEIPKARIRLVIGSVISNLKRQMRLEDHLAKTLPGLAQRIAQRPLALTLGILCNIVIGRPQRALAACDGR